MSGKVVVQEYPCAQGRAILIISFHLNLSNLHEVVLALLNNGQQRLTPQNCPAIRH